MGCCMELWIVVAHLDIPIMLERMWVHLYGISDLQYGRWPANIDDSSCCRHYFLVFQHHHQLLPRSRGGWHERWDEIVVPVELSCYYLLSRFILQYLVFDWMETWTVAAPKNYYFLWSGSCKISACMSWGEERFDGIVDIANHLKRTSNTVRIAEASLRM